MNKTTKIFLPILFLFNNLSGQNLSTNGEIYFHIGDQKITIPAKHVKFAKQVVSYETKDDFYSYRIKRKKIHGKTKIDSLNQSINHIELSYGDFVVLKFKKNKIKDVNGADIYVFAENLSGQAAISLSKDNKVWEEVGNITKSKKHINLSGKIDEGSKFSFLKIKNTSKDGSAFKLKQVGVIKSNSGMLGLKTKIINGEIYTKSDKVKLQIYDFRQFDGDLVSVKLNGRMISKTKLLTKWNRFVEIPLRKGENEIVVRAKTEGMLKPNTIDLKIVDGIIINIGSYKIRKKRTKTIRVFRE